MVFAGLAELPEGGWLPGECEVLHEEGSGGFC